MDLKKYAADGFLPLGSSLGTNLGTTGKQGKKRFLISCSQKVS
jgi:hypothetical protein